MQNLFRWLRIEKLKTKFHFLKEKWKENDQLRLFASATSGNTLNDLISNDNFFDIFMLRQVSEIGQIHQSLFTSQQPMLNFQQNFHWPFNSSAAIHTTQLSQSFSFRSLPSYIQHEKNKTKTLFVNTIKIPPVWNSTSKYWQD